MLKEKMELLMKEVGTEELMQIVNCAVSELNLRGIETEEILDGCKEEVLDEKTSEDEALYVVRRSYDYAKFKYLSGNRNITKNKLRNIIEGIRENGYIPSAIVVNEKFEIIDGQHRFEACKALGLPILYMMAEGLTAADAKGMNQAQSGWTFNDYIKAFGDSDPNFANVIKLIEAHKGLPLNTVLASVTRCYNNSSNGYTRKIIKKGILNFPEDNYAKTDAALTELEKVVAAYKAKAKGRTGRNDVFFSSIFYLMGREDFDKKYFIETINSLESITPDKSDFGKCVDSVAAIYSKGGKTFAHEDAKTYFNDVICKEVKKEVEEALKKGF